MLLAGKGHETYQILPTGTIHFDEREVVAEILGARKNESIYFTGSGGSLGLPQMQAQAILADVCTDTRKIQPGSLFVCLRGERFDGHSFASQAAKLGAAALLVDHPVDADVPSWW